MIQAVATPAHKQAFATAIQGAPYFRAVMGRDLALWEDNPGAPVRLFTMPGAALTLNGSTAQLCGTPQDWEELLSFLQFAGIAHLIAGIFGLVSFYCFIHLIRVTRRRLDWRALGQAFYTGSAELVSQLSFGITTFLFNILSFRYAGADGVAAYQQEKNRISLDGLPTGLP